ncbi:MAG: glycosyltransferase family 4 protein [Firmicutes bacterium]|nr:glycosyltransferase family 4 protein [Bacillota bacterium]
MKILIVCQYYYPENFAITAIAKTLVEFGHEVSVLTGLPNYGYGKILPGYKHVREEVIDGVKVHRVKLLPRKNSRISIIENYLSFWANSKRWARHTKEKYDVVYSMSLSPVISVSAANVYAKKHKVPHLLHCVDLWPESTIITKNVDKRGLIYAILLKWSHKIYQDATKIIIGSPSFKNYFEETLKIKDRVTDVIIQPAIVTKCEVEPIVYDSGFNIVYCGNIGTLQMLNLIVGSSAVLIDHPEVKFHVIGMGSEKQLFFNLVKEQKLENRIIYHGPLPSSKASAYFVNADALYVSLKNEGFVGKTIPNKLIMYMAFGKPIIGVVGGDARALLEQSGGAIFAEENSLDIAKAITTLLQKTTEEKNKLGLLNQTYFNSHFSLETLTRKIESHLLDLIK